MRGHTVRTFDGTPGVLFAPACIICVRDAVQLTVMLHGFHNVTVRCSTKNYTHYLNEIGS